MLTAAARWRRRQRRRCYPQVVDSWLLAHAVPQSVVQQQGQQQGPSCSPGDPAGGSVLAAAHSLSSSSSSLNGGSSSGAAANISPPMRKISACEFDRGSPLRPIVQTSFDGTPTFLTLPAAAEGLQVRTGWPPLSGRESAVGCFRLSPARSWLVMLASKHL